MGSYIISFGAMPEKKDVRDYVASLPMKRTFPEAFQLKMPAVKNQGGVSSCVAHSISTVVEYHNQRQQKNMQTFSVVYIYGNRDNTDYKGKGMYVREALMNYVNCGDIQNTMCPGNEEVPQAISTYNSVKEKYGEKAKLHRASQFFKLNTEDDMKAALQDFGPIVFSIKWFSDYELKNNILTRTRPENTQGGFHCMVIYGWDHRGWLVQNSWGRGYGVNGRFVLPFGTEFSTCYGIQDDIEYKEDEYSPDIDKPFDKWPKFLITIINFIINLFNKQK